MNFLHGFELTYCVTNSISSFDRISTSNYAGHLIKFTSVQGYNEKLFESSMTYFFITLASNFFITTTYISKFCPTFHILINWMPLIHFDE